MKKSYGSPTTAKVEVEQDSAAVDAAQLAEIEGDSLPATRDNTVMLNVGSVDGDVGMADMIVPRFNIVQGVGPLSEHFDSGDIVLDSEIVLAKKESPVSLIVLSIAKSYEESLPYDPSGPRPREFKSEIELREAGLWTEWRDGQPPPVKKKAIAMLLVQQPEGVDSLRFSYKVADKSYALAIWTMRGTAYNRAAKKIFTEEKLSLKDTGLVGGLWELSTKKEPINGNPVSVPVLRLTGKSTTESVAEITTLLD